MAEPLLPVAPSPTGEPVLPQWAVRVLSVTVIAAGSVGPFLPEGPYKTACLVLVALGAGFGIVSQGVRR